MSGWRSKSPSTAAHGETAKLPARRAKRGGAGGAGGTGGAVRETVLPVPGSNFVTIQTPSVPTCSLSTRHSSLVGILRPLRPQCPLRPLSMRPLRQDDLQPLVDPALGAGV